MEKVTLSRDLKERKGRELNEGRSETAEQTEGVVPLLIAPLPVSDRAEKGILAWQRQVLTSVLLLLPFGALEPAFACKLQTIC